MRGLPCSSVSKILPAGAETQFDPGLGDPWRKGSQPTPVSCLAWKISWTEGDWRAAVHGVQGVRQKMTNTYNV